MRAFLRLLTFGIVLVFGAGPAAIIACELACSSPSGHGEHHSAATHQHGAAVEHGAPTPGGFPLLTTDGSSCEHDAVGNPALTSSAVKVFAPIAIDVLDATLPDIRYTHVSVGASSMLSPPGARSAPLPLRI